MYRRHRCRHRELRRYRDPHGDHLPWLCDCHDCRKRRKHGQPTIPTPAERRDRDKLAAE
jgi:hypothetical protein